MSETITTSFETLRSATPDFDVQLDSFFASSEALTYTLRRPTSHTTTPGILVYISPKPGAAVPDGWDDVLDELNLVWVGAQNSGNDVHVAKRVGMAQLATTLAADHGPVDHQRTILSGFSGGGRVASMMMPNYPKRYQGALFICGANPLMFATPESLDALKDCPIYFLTGTGDFNLDDTQMAIVSYQQAGLRQTKLVIVQDLEHALPTAQDLRQTLNEISPPNSTAARQKG